MELQPIITAAKGGDKEAFAQLYEHTCQKVLAYAIVYLKMDIDEADDIIADAYITVYEKIDTFEDGRDFFPWLFAIVRNKAIDLQRKKSKIIYDHDRMLEILTEDNTTEEFTQQQREQALHSLIDDLPDRQREAVKLHYLDGLTVKETAEKMGISENTAKTHIQRGFTNLRDSITDKGGKETWLGGVAFMPLLSSLLQQDMAEGLYTVSGKATAKVLHTIGMKTAGASAASVGSAGTVAATTSTGAAATTAASVPTILGGIALTGGVKAIIVATAAVLVVGGTTGAYIYNEKKNEAVQAALIFQQEEDERAASLCQTI